MSEWPGYSDIDSATLNGDIKKRMKLKLLLGGNWKPQFCPESLLPELKADMIRREGKDINFYEEDSVAAFIDLPGMIMTDRGIESIDMGGWELRIPTSDFEFFFNEITNLKRRFFSDGTEYYKIHGWMHAVVLSSADRCYILDVMKDRLEFVRYLADKEEEEFEKRLATLKQGGHIIERKGADGLPLTGVPNNEIN